MKKVAYKNLITVFSFIYALSFSSFLFLPTAEAATYTTTDKCKIDLTVSKPGGNINAVESFTIYKDQLSGYRANIKVVGDNCKNDTIELSVTDSTQKKELKKVTTCSPLTQDKEVNDIDFTSYAAGNPSVNVSLLVYSKTDCVKTSFLKTLSIKATYSTNFAPLPQQVRDSGIPGNLEVISNPIKNVTFIGLAFSVMKYFLGAIAGLAIVFIMIGAVQLIFSQGNPETVTRGKDTITWAVVGLIVAIFAFSMVAIVQGLIKS